MNHPLGLRALSTLSHAIADPLGLAQWLPLILIDEARPQLLGDVYAAAGARGSTKHEAREHKEHARSGQNPSYERHLL